MNYCSTYFNVEGVASIAGYVSRSEVMTASEKLSMPSGMSVTRHMMRLKNLEILQSELPETNLLEHTLRAHTQTHTHSGIKSY